MPNATHIPTSPPDALASLADAMSRSLVLDGAVLRRELEQLGGDIVPPEEWLIQGTTLCAEVVTAIGAWPPPVPTTAQDFARYAGGLQRLDRWHRPLLPDEIALPRLVEHEALLDRMALEDRFNSNGAIGTVIARQAFGSPFLKLDNAELDWSVAPKPYAVLCAMLDVCVFLPASITACDPDDEIGAVSTRRVALSFKRFPSDEPSLPWPLDDLRIAVAPVAEAETDASIWVEGDRYSIHPEIPLARLEALISLALTGGAHLLLMPEMTVDEQHLMHFAASFRRLRRQSALASPTEMPSLRMALIGVIARPSGAGAAHRNYIAVVNGRGEILFTQDKLSHWNLYEPAQSRFGLSRKGYAVPLREDTVPGSKIVVAEFDGLGRIMALICADMSQNMPGDWIADHIGLDWLYAPIMDGSTCWAQGGAPWIIGRAARSCAQAGTTVIVTNSMVMTHWNNRVITLHRAADPAYPYVNYSACGIGLVIRWNGLARSVSTSPLIWAVLPPRCCG